MKPLWCAIAFSWLLCMAGAPEHAAAADAPYKKQLIVGTKDAPPFSVKRQDGSWGGVGIDLWREIAKELDLEYTFREMDLAAILNGLESGEIDAGVAAITVTAERDSRIDFSHPFYTTGLAIAISSRGGTGWGKTIQQLFTVDFLSAVSALALLLLAVGVLIWVLERRKNTEQFSGGPVNGIGAGFWWSAVTMTTVGYGDKAPRTLLGRILAIVWMFASIIMISSFTAAIASSLTVTRLESSVGGPEDLPYVTVGSIPGSTSAEYLDHEGIAFHPYTTPEQGLLAVARGNIDAMVYDAPILRYYAFREFPGQVQVLPKTFQHQDYAIALRPGSALREPINHVLLREIKTKAWEEMLRSYLGR